MAGLITQLNTANAGIAILNNATRASTQFNNSATSLLSELAAWEATLPDANLDSATLTEIETLKTNTISSIQTQLSNLQTALAAL